LGRRRKGRSISGILLLDKPSGLSSNAVLQRVKRVFDACKAGHTGSLDPLATGLLPICLGEATKMSTFLLTADKTYLATCHLGIVTTTADKEGEVVEQHPVPRYSQTTVKHVLTQFLGNIQQLPPMYSALKHKGQPLYKLARQGIEVDRALREIVIHEIELVDYHGHELLIKVRCSKGTYIRTLAQDIGAALGCGAHIKALRRLKVGAFELDQACTLEQLGDQDHARNDRHLLPMESALMDLPDVRLTERAAHYLCHGQAVFIPKAPTVGWVKLFEQQGQFIGIGQVLEDGRIAPKRLVASV